jgi:ABC-2 type transport system permease protein
MRQYLAALKFSFKEQLTNKFAFGLLIVFVPIWYWMLGAITSSDRVAFRFRATGGFLQANGHDLVLITAGLNVLTMILGFMFFYSARRSMSFDKRLTRAGLGRLNFMAAKIVSLLVTTGLVALYTVLMLTVFWHFPRNIFEVWLGFWLVSLIYGSLGLLLGMLLNNELVGFFIVIMVSMMDTFLQNPIGNPAANKPFLEYFPSYAPTQLGVAGGFTHLFAGGQVLTALCWFVGFLLIALSIFYTRTRRKSSVVRSV